MRARIAARAPFKTDRTIMNRILPVAALACAGALLRSAPAFAHAVCGSRVYPVTLTLDDPGVADELTLPQIVYTRAAADGGPGPSHDTSIQFEYDKRLTDEFGFAFNDDYNVNQQNNAKTETGWDDVTVTAKWAKCVDPDSDFQLGFGVIREFGRTGTSHIGSDEHGNTAPTIYLGKGVDEIPVPMLQPLQFTGELSYAVADREFKQFTVVDPSTGVTSTHANTGYPNAWIGSFSVQYSIPYLQNQIRDFGLPEPFAHMIPVAEFNWTSAAASPGGSPASWTLAPGFIYLRSWYQVGVEALVPLDKAAGTNVGFIVQFHVFIDDLYPRGIGAPLVEYFR
jgi:hypothetical protein